MDDFDWYLLDRGGRRYGPYERDFVEQLVAQREVLADTRVWHPGLSHWLRADEVLTFAPEARVLGSAGAQSNVAMVRAAPEAPRSTQRPVPKPAVSAPAHAPAPTVASKSRPAAARVAVTPAPILHVWQRVLAGVFDLLLVAVVLQLIDTLVLADTPAWLTTRAGLLVGWVLLDAWLLPAFGATPGKALLGVKIRAADGSKLDPRTALLRAGMLPLALLILSGLGPVFSFFSLLLLAAAWQWLRSGRKLWWDEMTRSTVSYAEISQPRRVLAIAAFALLLFVLAWLRQMPQGFAQRWI
jgi:uncharacterized RDD family membrane protein YckC